MAAAPATPAPASPSYARLYTAPPPVKRPYKPADALADLPGVGYALDTFLASQMIEAEEYCNESDKEKQRLYFATGYGLIQCVKALMSYADDDLLSALGHTKQGNLIAAQHRKRAPALTSRLAGYVVSSLNTTGVGWIKGMTAVERHAELVYAESLFEKALLGIVYSGDWLAFIKEALNMRTIVSIYRTLYKYIQTADAEYAASAPPGPLVDRGHGPESPAIDAHFRSGVYLGAGMSTLILSLLPGRLLNLVELFGYHADRKEGLDMLARAGGWGKADEPLVSTQDEGVRRAICDLALLIFHLVLSTVTFDGVDVHMAERIVRWNLKRYPDGVLFLFAAGRLALAQSQPRKAIEHHTRAMQVQTQYRNLHHVSFWEMAIAGFALGHVASGVNEKSDGFVFDGSEGCWRILEKEASWSKAIYSYGLAVSLLEPRPFDESAEDREKRLKEVSALMEKVPTSRQKIAGKSIPLEKFVARKARKYTAQSGRLALPVLELGYFFLSISRAPRNVVEGKMLPEVRAQLVELDKPESEKNVGYADDLCLARFLEGVCLRYVAYPDPDAIRDPAETPLMTRDEAAAGSKRAFEAVFEHGPKIELDHWIVYHAHYEYGRLLACMDNESEARTHLELVMSGKYLEVGTSGKKGKYSLENALHMRTSAALEALHQKRL
ncbi:unnamed protein product [Mycena citricolor]|uniref:Uncharacterized protein n=1 Tax=Mycena citricolor TaxID=2018698 RepID=A0AAD2H3C2_9AGAR|nr:unnamed protein product [Mycena citricolor]